MLQKTVKFSKDDFEGKTLTGLADHTSAFNVVKMLRNHFEVSLKDKDIIELKEVMEVSLRCLNRSERYFEEKGFIQTEMILPKVAIVETVLEYLDIDKFTFLQASGGCLGYISLKANEETK